MNKGLGFIYVTTILLFIIFNNSNFTPAPIQDFSFNQERRKALYELSIKESVADVLIAYSSGERRWLDKKIKQAHTRLHLSHLFTPSGLHFSAILLILSLPLLYLRKKNKMITDIIEFLILVTPFIFDGFNSIKRIALIRLFFLISKKTKIDLSPFTIFLLVFFVDFIRGSWQESPLSFIYSFLFLGSIFSSVSKGPKGVIFSLFFGQLFMSALFQNIFYPLGFFIGVLFTWIFSVFFPYLFMLYLFPNPVFSFVIGNFFLKFQNLISFLGELNLPHFTPPFAIILLMLTFFFIKKKVLRITLLTVIGALYSTMPLNVDSPKKLKSISLNKTMIKRSKINSIRRTKKGYALSYNNKICYHTLFDNGYKKKCKKKGYSYP